MSKKQTLLDRTQSRNKWDATKKQWPVAEDHIRAELDRLARKVKKLNTYDNMPLTSMTSRWIRQIDVLDLIRDAKR